MSDAWKDRARVKEEEYFARMEREALERLQSREKQPKRKSPIDGSEMEQLSIAGLVLDRDSVGGVYFDKAEVQRLHDELENATDGVAWVKELLKKLLS